jgi:hypothetical protein
MEEWPALPYGEWQDTLDTLHMCAQVIGKLRLALSPFEPQWANVALTVTARGLITPPMAAGAAAFDAELDLLGDELVLRSGEGGVERVALGARAGGDFTVADFYEDTMRALGRLGAEVAISTTPSEVADPIPFPEDRSHHSYDPEAVHRYFRVLAAVDLVFKRHRARFRGRTSLVQFFWGSFDLSLTRFSGRPASPPPGADIIMRRSADVEQICAGFWPGDGRFPHPAFFAYGYPQPEGIQQAVIGPDGAGWSDAIGEFLLPYDSVRAAPSPALAITEFLETSYAAAAERLGWSPDLVATDPEPGAA